MRTPEIVSIVVVEEDGQKKFQLPDSSLTSSILAGKYGSYLSRPSGFDKEIDTPFVVFRKGEYYDLGVCEYIFGSDGYHVVSGMRHISTGSDHLTSLHAPWFETGDVIAFVRIPSGGEMRQQEPGQTKPVP